MKNIFLLSILAITSLSACFRDKYELEPLKPQISVGFYSSEKSEDKNIPLVAVQEVDGVPYTYSFVWYQCQDKVTATFYNTGVTKGVDKSTVDGPVIREKGTGCDVDTLIEGDTASTIKVTAKLNGVSQEPYTLSKVSKENFVEKIKVMSTKADQFSISEETCQKSLSSSCEGLGLKPAQ